MCKIAVGHVEKRRGSFAMDTSSWSAHQSALRRLLSRLLPAAVLALLGLFATAALSHPDRHEVHVGWLLGSTRLAAVALDISDAKGRRGPRTVVAYVCDGLGLPSGVAAWFKGELGDDGTANLTSAGGTETLEIQFSDENGANGVFVDAAQTRTRFDVAPAQAGAGIYDVTLDSGLRYRGTSTDGAVLDAQADGSGHVVGTIRSRGERVRFRVSALALLSSGELAADGLPDFSVYAANALVPGQYVAVITAGARFWMGRSGSVRAGSPASEIIGLDKSTRQ